MSEGAMTASEMASLGGKARAKSMTAAERREHARRAVAARWNADLPVATHGSPDHPLKIGSIEIPCYVLDDGRRVVTQRGFQAALGMNASGGARRLLSFVESVGATGIDCKDLESRVSEPIKFILSNSGSVGVVAHGYEASALADMCDVILEARKAGVLLKRQMHYADYCEILLRSFARVGIIALVDEATGYQRNRERDELAKLLEAFVAKEIQRYLKTFDLEFYELMCELRGEPLERAKKRPAYFGRLTNNLIYQRLAPGVLQKLQEVNPVMPETGRRKSQHHRHLTPDIGHPKLREHLSGIVAAMRFAKVMSVQWEVFMKALDKTHPKYHPMPLFDHIGGDQHGSP